MHRQGPQDLAWVYTRALTPLMMPQMFNLDRNEKRDYLSVGETELDTLYWVGSGGRAGHAVLGGFRGAGWTLGGFRMRGQGG